MAAVLAILVLGIGSGLVAHQIADTSALQDAREGAQAIADNLAAPLVTDAFRDGSPDAIGDLRRLMENRMRDGSIAHVSIYSVDGTVLWSDIDSMIEQQVDFDPDQLEVLDSGQAYAEFSDLSGMPNVVERDAAADYIEAFAPTTGADGEPLLFETYLSTDPIADRRTEVWTYTLIVALVALVVFAAVILPTSLALAGRVRDNRAERSRMARHARQAGDTERRRIAQVLHDGVVQDLSGVGYVLPDLAHRVAVGTSRPGDAETLRRLGDVIAGDVVSLREMMAEIYPPDLLASGLEAALGDVVAETPTGAEVVTRIDPDLDLGPGAARMIHVVVREGIRNVARHAAATTVLIEVRRDHDQVHVVVADDGAGVRLGDSEAFPTVDGHFGLRLIADLVGAAGGTLRMVPNEPRGARLEVSFPHELAPA